MMNEKLAGLVNKYRMLRAERDAGQISDDEYKRQLESAAVPDPRNPGCWWNISPESGLWIFFDGSEWTQKTPEGFEPMVNPSATPVPTVQRAGGPATRGGGKAWIWIVVVVIVLVAAGASIAVAIMISGGGGAPSGDRAERDIENLLEDFFDAADDADFEDLMAMVTDDLESDLKEAEDDGSLDRFLRPYKSLDVQVIKSIKVDGDRARAKAVLRRGNEEIEQRLKLRLDGRDWKVADASDIEPRGGDAGRVGGSGGSNEQQVMNFLQDFLQTYKNFDIDRLKTMVDTRAYSDMEIESLEAIREDPEQLAAFREYLQQLTWDDPSGSRATVTVLLNVAPEPFHLTLERTGGVWKVVSIAD